MSLSTDDLLARMRCVMWDGHLRRWDARALDGLVYGHGATPRDAMLAALDVALNGDLF